MLDTCPHCQASWIGNPIPPQHQEAYGNNTHFNDAIALRCRESYEVVAWECPDCHSRFDAGTWERQSVNKGSK